MDFIRRMFRGDRSLDQKSLIPPEVTQYNFDAALERLKTVEDFERNQRDAFELYRKLTGYEKSYEDVLRELERGFAGDNETVYRISGSSVRARLLFEKIEQSRISEDPLYNGSNVPMVADADKFFLPAYHDLVQKFLKAGIVIKFQGRAR